MRGRGFQASQTRAFSFFSGFSRGFQIGTAPGLKPKHYYAIASLQRWSVVPPHESTPANEPRVCWGPRYAGAPTWDNSRPSGWKPNFNSVIP